MVCVQDPGATCLVYGGERVTYRQVETRSNQLGNWLVANGVTPNAAVAVCMDKRPEMYIALLAVLKAGGCYVPLDAGLPAETASFMLQQAECRVLLTHVRGCDSESCLPALWLP